MIISILLAMLLISFCSASFDVGNKSDNIQAYYGPNDNVGGWINISIEDEPANNVFEDSRDNSISIGELAELSSNFAYSCMPQDCTSDYDATDGEDAKSYSVAQGDSQLIGFKITGQGISIRNVSFEVESDVGDSCYNQIALDFLADDIIEKINYKQHPTEDCPILKTSGCFDETYGSFEESSIDEIPYCQKINLTVSPGFTLGAWIKEEIAGTQKLTLNLMELDGALISQGSCEIDKAMLTSGGGEVSCSVNYTAPEVKEAYICIRGDSGDGEYKIRSYSTASKEKCGFYGLGIHDPVAAYNLFLQGKKFTGVGVISFTNELEHGNTLSDLFSGYIMEKYGTIDCENGCVVPLKINAKQAQNLDLRNLEIKYDKAGAGTGYVERNFYVLGETPALLSTDGYSLLDLEHGEFDVPNSYGNYTFRLKLDDESVLSKKVFVERVPQISSLSPRTTSSGVPTEFTVNVNTSSEGVKSYKWEFGDSQEQTTTEDKTTHTYNNSGSYELKITVKDLLDRESSKTFNINVGSPEEFVNATLVKYEANLESITSEIETYDDFTKSEITGALDLENSEEELNQVRRLYVQSQTEEDFKNLVSRLLELNIPNKIEKTGKGDNIIYYPSPSSISLTALAEVSSEDYSSGESDSYENAILAWHNENIESKISFRAISAHYEGTQEQILSIFTITTNEIGNPSTNPYLILREIDDLTFKLDYLEENIAGNVYIELEQKENSFSFSTTEEIMFQDLPLFISVPIERLSITIDNIPPGEDEGINWWLFILAAIVLLAIGVGVYFALEYWYRVKYETHLFKNRNNLFNLVTYIQSERKKGLKDDELATKLKKAGWSKEQAAYALKKHSGKHTGMIPLVDLFKPKKKTIYPATGKGNLTPPPQIGKKPNYPFKNTKL